MHGMNSVQRTHEFTMNNAGIRRLFYSTSDWRALFVGHLDRPICHCFASVRGKGSTVTNVAWKIQIRRRWLLFGFSTNSHLLHCSPSDLEPNRPDSLECVPLTTDPCVKFTCDRRGIHTGIDLFSWLINKLLKTNSVRWTKRWVLKIFKLKTASNACHPQRFTCNLYGNFCCFNFGSLQKKPKAADRF